MDGKHDSECNDGDHATSDMCNVAKGICEGSSQTSDNGAANDHHLHHPLKPPTRAPISAHSKGYFDNIHFVPHHARARATTDFRTYNGAYTRTRNSLCRRRQQQLENCHETFLPLASYSLHRPVRNEHFTAHNRRAHAQYGLQFSFEIRLHNPSNIFISKLVVSCLEGAWQFADGREEALKCQSTILKTS
jgi:ribosomal protein L34E